MSSSKSDAMSTPKVFSQEYSENINIVRQHRLIEDFLIIWLDSHTNAFSNDYENAITHLQSIGNSIKVFDNGNKCNDFLYNVKDCKVFLIISDSFDTMYIPLIHDASQLDSIYVLCAKVTWYEYLLKEWRKIRGVYSDISVICNKIKKDIRHREHNLTPFSVITASYPVVMNELDSSFMYSQLLKDILLGMHYNEEARREFIDFLRIQYVENTITLSSIDKFEQEYDIRTPIWWYTKELFIYTVLNKALRTQDIEVIIKMGFFVQDLCRQIGQAYSGMCQKTKLVVYRGQCMSSEEFEKIKQCQGGLLAFKCFLSTSTDRQVAFAFAESARNDPDLIGVFFQMEIDASITPTPFASLNDISYYSNSESEILFSMHTVFRIGHILQVDDELWQVNLILTNDCDEQLRNLTSYISKEFEDVIGYHKLGKLMVRMDKFDKAEEIFMKLLERASDKSLLEIADLHSELGNIKHSQGNPSNALAHFEKALEIKEKILMPTDPNLAKAYSSIGTTYCAMANYSTALSYHEKSLKIKEEVLSPIHPDLGIAYNTIGVVHDEMGNYATAHLYYKKSLEIREKILPPIHATLAITYNNIGRLYKLMGDYSTALSYYEKTLNIEQKSLPREHSSLATTYNNIAGVYLSLRDYSNTLMYLEKTLKIQQESLPPTHPTLGVTYNNIGAVYISINDYSTAHSNLQKALEILRNSLSPIHPTLAKAYNNIGRVYDSMGDYSTAFSYYEKTLEIQQKSLPSSHPDVAFTYNRIGSVLNALGRYEQAVIYAKRAVDITHDTLGCDHPTVRKYQEDVEQFRLKL